MWLTNGVLTLDTFFSQSITTVIKYLNTFALVECFYNHAISIISLFFKKMFQIDICYFYK